MFDRNARSACVRIPHPLPEALSVPAAALILGLSGPAAAGVFTASSSATLTITGISSPIGGDLADLSIIADDSFFIEDFFVIPPAGNAGGDANADTQVTGFDPFDLGIDEGVEQTASVSGFAAGRNAAVDAIAFASTSIEILNNSADLFTLDFLLSYDLTATADGDDASAIAYINAASSFGGFSLFEEVELDPSSGFFDTPLTGSIPFSLDVDQGGVRQKGLKSPGRRACGMI